MKSLQNFGRSAGHHRCLDRLVLFFTMVAQVALGQVTIAPWGNASPLPAGMTNVAAIASGWYHTLVLRSNGTLTAWGDNFYLQTNVPPTATNVAAIGANRYNNLALLSNGTVLAWGRNDVGQTNVPAGLSNVVAVAAGGEHNLALRRDGKIVSWGANTDGQTNVPAGLPVFLLRDVFDYGNGPLVGSPGSPWVAHSAGGASPIVVSNGAAQIAGISPGEDINAPLTGAPYDPAGGATLYASFRARFVELPRDNGAYFAHLKDAGTIFRGRVWAMTNGAAAGLFRLGIGNASGTLSTPWTTDLSLNTTYTVIIRCDVATGVSTLWVNATTETDPSITATDVSSGVALVGFALRQNAGGGTVLVDDVRVGTSFAHVTGSPVRGIAAGRFHSMALLENGRVVAWGYHGYGQTNVPSSLTNAQAVVGGYSHCVALRSNGTVITWGTNLFAYGQTNIPDGLSGVTAIASTAFHSLALKTNGVVFGWGDNSSGECFTPPEATDAIAIAAGWGNSLALVPRGARIYMQPLGQFGFCGDTVNFSVAAVGDQPLFYQWRFNGVPIPNATESLLQLQSVSCANIGQYSVLVSNAFGSLTSSNAQLDVAPGGSLLVNCPSETVVLSWDDVPPPDTNAVLVQNACAPLTRQLLSEARQTNGCETLIFRTYRVVDSCSRTGACTQTIFVRIRPDITGFTTSSSAVPGGILVSICVSAIGASSFSWTPSTPFLATSNSGNCFYGVVSPTEEGPAVATVLALNSCGTDGGPSPPINPCAICLSRGTPNLLVGTSGSGSGITNTSGCGNLTTNARWFKLVVTNYADTGWLTLSTERMTNNGTLAVYTGSITSPNSMTRIGCDTNSLTHPARVTFNADYNTVYWVAVDARTNNAPTLQLASGFEPAISTFRFGSNRTFEVFSTLAPPISYTLEMTTNLATWTKVQTTNASTGYPYLHFRDPTATNSARRFYRMKSTAQ